MNFISPEICRRLPEQQPRFYIPNFWAFFVTPPRFTLVKVPSAEKTLFSLFSITCEQRSHWKTRTCSSVALLFLFSLPRKFRRFLIRFSSTLQNLFLYLHFSRDILQGLSLTAFSLSLVSTILECQVVNERLLFQALE